MCGIVGFTSAPSWDSDVLADMVRCLDHRGPDATGFHRDSDIAFGHSRLTIIAPDGGAQPRIDAETGDVLVYNGEIYGYREQADQLRERGIKLADNSDTEVLFKSIQHYGISGALDRLDGMFAFAFKDGASGNLYLARDRFGEKPLFYGFKDGTFVFGSELKALLQHPLYQDAPFDPGAIDRYLSFEFLAGRDSGYSGIGKLEPGHLLTFADGKIESKPYWRPVFTHINPSENEAIDRLDDLLRASVRQRLVADVPVGVFLSGGLDSSIIAAIANEFSPNITAYTIQAHDTYDESLYARRVADHCGLTHVVSPLTDDDILSAVQAIPGFLDEPIADYSLIPTYLLCALARKNETVALGGDGADELFAGYGTFKAAYLSPLMAQIPPLLGRWFRGALDLMPASEGYMNSGFIARQISTGFGYSGERQSLLWLAPFTDDERKRLWSKDVRADLKKNALFCELDHILDTQPNDISGMARIMDLYLRSYLPEDILAKVDRSAMAVSLETRLPYLDRAFAEYSLSLPLKMKIQRGQTKGLLKKLGLRYLPEDIVYRKKQGFGFPLGSYLRTNLKDLVWKTLLDPSNVFSAWFDRREIERYLQEHQSARRDHRKKIWALFILFSMAHHRHLTIHGAPSSSNNLRSVIQ